MLPKELKPNHLYDLIRVRRNDDCSFEKEFKNLHNIEVLCFDHDIGIKFWFKKFSK